MFVLVVERKKMMMNSSRTITRTLCRLSSQSTMTASRLQGSKVALGNCKVFRHGISQTDMISNGLLGQQQAAQQPQRMDRVRFFSSSDEKKPEADNKETETTQGQGEGDAGAADQSKEVEELKTKLAKMEEEVKEAKDNMLRSYAEMENVRQRTKREIESATTYANQKFAKSMLIVADNLSLALESVPEDQRENNVLFEGVKMTESELLKIFNANGIVPFGEPGEKFDPNHHDAMFQMPHPDYEPDTVAQVIKKGYKYKDRVLRAAQVGTVVKS